MFKFHNFSLTAWLWLWLWIMFAAASARAQQALAWEQVRARFEQSNPTLLADKLSVDESRAQEITAFLRPNPTFTLSAKLVIFIAASRLVNDVVSAGR